MGASSMSSRPTAGAGIVFVAAGDFEIFQIQVVVRQRRHLRVDLLHGLAGDLLQLVVFDHHRFDRQAGLELDLVQRVQVGGIGDGHEQALAALEQRQDAMFGEQLVGNQLDHVEVELNGIQVEQRHAEFLGRGDRDFLRLRDALGDQVRHQIAVGSPWRRSWPASWSAHRPDRPGSTAGAVPAAPCAVGLSRRSQPLNTCQ